MDLFRLAIVAAVGVANIGLALVVYSRNSKSPANRAFAGAVFVIVFWLALDFMGDQPLFAPYALSLKRATLAAGMLMGALLLHFAHSFPQRTGPLSAGWRIYFALGGVLVGTTVLTNTIWSGEDATGSGTKMVAGPLLPLVAAWAAAGILLMVIILTDRYRRAERRQKAQLKYMLLGVSLFAVASLLLGLVVPMLTGMYQLAELNTLSTLFLVGFIAYAMVKHRLMDIRLVVFRGAAYTLLVAISAAFFVALIGVLRTGVASSLNLNPDALFFFAGLVAVFGFQPLRRALERVTDRLFYRRRYDPQQLLRRLSAGLATTVDLRRLVSLLTDTLADQMKLTFAAIVYGNPLTPELVSTQPDTPRIDPGRLLALCHDGALVVADDLEDSSEAAPVLTEHGVRVLVPLVVEDHVLGGLALGAKHSGEMFSAEDVRFLEILVPEAAMAMKKAELLDDRNRRVSELTALNKLAFSLGANIELESLLAGALEQIVAVTQADSGSIMLADEESGTLTIGAACGVGEDIVRKTRVRLGEGIAGRVAKTREALILVSDTDPRFKDELRRQDIVSAMTAPLVSKDKVIGVLNVNRKKSADLFTRENLNVVTSFAGQLAVAIENSKLYRDLENTFIGTIAALAATVDAKDPYTHGHSEQVMTYAAAIAERLGLGEQEIQTVRIASGLHDIGKIGIDGSILHKPGKLTDEERAEINRHPTIGANILASLEFLRDVVPLILFHHERYGGGGYPSGVSGEAVPLGARIISVADSFNAMVSDRPYRKALPFEIAVKELRDNAGTQFDPSVVNAFLEVLDADEEAPRCPISMRELPRGRAASTRSSRSQRPA